MNLHEYQAKKILEKFGIPTPPFTVISAISEVEGIKEGVLKIQVHAGGRGKAGGVKVAKTPEDVRGAAEKLLGLRMVNAQTGPKG